MSFARICGSSARLLVAMGMSALLFASAGQVHGAVVQFLPAVQNSAAIGVNGTATYDPINLYSTANGFGVAFLIPIVPIELPRGGVDGGLVNFQTKLNGAQGKYVGTNAPVPLLSWSYAKAGADLPANSLQVTAYDVHGGADYVGIDGNLGANPRTAGFAVKDKNPPANAHWLQVIYDNNAIVGGVTKPGTTENIIDIGANTSTPYYDDGGAADATNFFDAPRRPDVTFNNFWIADLYVASGPNTPGKITIYNGMAYGWANIFVNTKGMAGNPVQNFKNAIDGDFSNITNLDTAFGGGSDLSPYLSSSDLQTLDRQFDSSVPEPSTLALATGLPMLLLRRRRAAR